MKADKADNISPLTIPPISNDNLNSSQISHQNSLETEVFRPEIIPLNDPLSDKVDLITSMTKDQVELHCKSLLNKTIKSNDQLSLAVVNCMVSNYQEPLQSVHDTSYLKKKKTLRNACQKQFRHTNYSQIEKQLLIGMCISDKITQ
ncbi:hypothetical protein OO007_08380 [Cocleimonas sp. KMM 6892]|uniref:hypothetical protein n=1 Tax=unclassified Cocleimonas TaxID=2639732 RepID=UPI002DBF3C10|nr:MULTISPECIES: hypothetical protein [unclassified Cocleimonas]MEB8432243.1 hypothetical protein [Cocleimonas sp. KMM 6892]MEC4714671.1 hypothetical protein [Cocleimonas sp. KMM 6895]MEC4744515.1 hypothetical protein [Cocleimonas sp. KMM 6896]